MRRWTLLLLGLSTALLGLVLAFSEPEPPRTGWINGPALCGSATDLGTCSTSRMRVCSPAEQVQAECVMRRWR